MSLKEVHVVVFIPHGNQHLGNGGKGVANCIMGSNVFVAMNTT
jgi:hypothetical protein